MDIDDWGRPIRALPNPGKRRKRLSDHLSTLHGAGRVYVIGSEEFGWYKVGVTHRANNGRLDDVRTSVPFDTEVYGIWPAKCWARSIEQQLLSTFKSQRIRKSEWIELTPTQRDTLLRLVKELCQADEITGGGVW